MAHKSAIDWFYEGAAYSAPAGASKAEREQARQAEAEALAEAEEHAWASKWYFEWTPSEDGGEIDEYYDAVLFDAKGRVLASLREVDLSRNSADARRVVEAELALDALETLGALEMNPNRKRRPASLGKVAEASVREVVAASPSLSKSAAVETAYRNAAAEDPSLWSKWRAFKKAAEKAYDAS
jgi:hypothetical protein